jgi:hypothetical protein
VLGINFLNPAFNSTGANIGRPVAQAAGVAFSKADRSIAQ